MAKALGIGGIFFKSASPDALGNWYAKWLGLPVESFGGCSFQAADMPSGAYTVWSPFNADTDYFQPSKRDFMINLVVDDLDGALSQVLEGGAEQAGEIEVHEYGRFVWFIDPEGNKVELWEPNVE